MLEYLGVSIYVTEVAKIGIMEAIGTRSLWDLHAHQGCQVYVKRDERSSLKTKKMIMNNVWFYLGCVDNCPQDSSSRGMSAGSIDANVRSKSLCISHAMLG